MNKPYSAHHLPGQFDAIQFAAECIGCSHEGRIVTDVNGTIADVNAAAERILETLPATLTGTDVRKFCLVRQGYDEILRHAENQGRSLNRPVILQTESGKRKLVNMSIQRVGEGGKAQFVHVFQDCADLRTMEERLVQSERLATIGKFASQIAHEIRNPLGSMSLNLELLEDELQGTSGEAWSLLRSVQRELDRLNDIVGEYLQFSRFPKPHLTKGKVDGVVEDLCRTYKLKPSVTLEFSLMPQSPEIWLDDRLLRQVLDNLIRNAADAIDTSGTIRIETDVTDRFLVIRVKDNGCGIPPEMQPKLFEPFFTTKPHGTGLGLATTQQIVFEHNGHLLVESEPGKGSAFTVLLPL